MNLEPTPFPDNLQQDLEDRGFDWCTKRDCQEEQKGTIMQTMLAMMSLVNQYNNFANKQNIDGRKHLYPKLTMGYHFEESKVRLYLKVMFDEGLKGAFDIKYENSKRIVALLDEKGEIEYKYNKLAASLQDKEAEFKRREAYLDLRSKELDEEWKKLESIEGKPELTVCMTEEQLRNAIEKELRKEYAYELEDLNKTE